MRVALDATYSLGRELSGVGVYSRELLNGLAASELADRWEWFYRSQRFWRALREPKPPRVTRRFLSESWGSRSAALFHGLNQRLPAKRFKRQVATFHDLFVMSAEYSTPDFRERFTAQARAAAAGADLIIAVSTFTALQVEDLLGFPASRIRVIHHGIPERAAPNSGTREKMVLCVGAIQRRKNQARLVRAFAAMPEDWKLVLAGSEGFQAAETQQAIRDSRCATRIRVTGYASDAEVAELYRKASIFAFPSLDEGFGMPVLEAMQAGIPVIAGNGSSLPEICGDAAVLVDPKSEQELADSLRHLAENESERNSLITRGFARVREFSWQKAVAQTETVYRELL